MHLQCPHCHDPIEVPGDATVDVLCPTCGSNICLDTNATQQEATADYQKKLGRFVLVEKVGTGAYGTVFKARDSQLDRTVAIKVPRASNLPEGYGKDRFLREARSVAQLRHPSIVSVHEVGEDAGLPFIVSDFVEGVTLAEYLSAKKLTFREAAELVAHLADALQYAHDHGVVHRDVKPSNIMLESGGRSQESGLRKRVGSLTPDSCRLTPKLMDFGLAKRDAGEITMTLDGQVLGTPAYMSPEQAKGEAHQVDGRSDVYSLGVILYELLTGELPFRGATRMLIHQLLHDEPRPPRRLNDRIPRDLETICLKAMAKESGRRYQAARDFAGDLGRWLKGEPIRARPVGPVEMAWRWSRRNPGVAGLSAVLASVILGSLIGLTVLYLNADAQRRRAEGAEGNWKEAAAAAQASAQKAKDEELKASEEALDTKAFSKFLVDDVLAVARPEGERGGLGIKVTVKQALDEAAKGIDKRFQGRPRAEAVARHDLGVSYRLMGDLPAAEEQLSKALELRRAALGQEHVDTLDTQNSLAVVLINRGRPKEAIKLLEESLPLCRSARGPDHSATLGMMGNLANAYRDAGRTSEAIHLLEEALELMKTQLEPSHPHTLATMSSLGDAYAQNGRLDKAMPLLEETLSIRQASRGAEHPDTLRSMHNLASAYVTAGRLPDAISLLEKTVLVRRAKLGTGHPHTQASMMLLGRAYANAGRNPDAIQLFEEILQLRRASPGSDHPDTIRTMNELGFLYVQTGQPHRAVPLFESCLRFAREQRGPQQADTLIEIINLGVAYEGSGRWADAIPLFEESLRLSEAQHGAEHPYALNSRISLAQCYDKTGRAAEAEALLREALAIQRNKLASDHPDLAKTLGLLAGVLLGLKKAEAAEPMARECLAIRVKKLPPEHKDTAFAKSFLGACLVAQKKFADAEPMLLQAHETLTRAHGLPPEQVKGTTLWIIQLYEDWGRKDKADEWRKKLEAPKKE